MFPDKHRDFCLGERPVGHTPNEILDFPRLGVEPARVQAKEGQKGYETYTLVSIDERVISHEMEEISCRHFVKASM